MHHIRFVAPLLLLAACSGSGTPTAGGDAVVADDGAPRPAPGPPELEVEAGTGVLISGTFTYTGTQAGAYRVDILKPGEANNPTLLKALTLPAQGAWEFEMPKNYGPILVNGFIDVGQKGPGHGEPSASVADLTVAETPLTGIALVLVDGAVAASAPPPEPGAPPPEGGSPTAGAAPATAGAAPGTPPEAGPAPGATAAPDAAAGAGAKAPEATVAPGGIGASTSPLTAASAVPNP